MSTRENTLMKMAPADYVERIPSSCRSRRVLSGDMQGSFYRATDRELLCELERRAEWLYVRAKVARLVPDKAAEWGKLSEDIRNRWRELALLVFYQEEGKDHATGI